MSALPPEEKGPADGRTLLSRLVTVLGQDPQIAALMGRNPDSASQDSDSPMPLGGTPTSRDEEILLGTELAVEPEAEPEGAEGSVGASPEQLCTTRPTDADWESDTWPVSKPGFENSGTVGEFGEEQLSPTNAPADDHQEVSQVWPASEFGFTHIDPTGEFVEERDKPTEAPYEPLTDVRRQNESLSQAWFASTPSFESDGGGGEKLVEEHSTAATAPYSPAGADREQLGGSSQGWVASRPGFEGEGDRGDGPVGEQSPAGTAPHGPTDANREQLGSSRGWLTSRRGLESDDARGGRLVEEQSAPATETYGPAGAGSGRRADSTHGWLAPRLGLEGDIASGDGFVEEQTTAPMASYVPAGTEREELKGSSQGSRLGPKLGVGSTTGEFDKEPSTPTEAPPDPAAGEREELAGSSQVWPVSNLDFDKNRSLTGSVDEQPTVIDAQDIVAAESRQQQASSSEMWPSSGMGFETGSAIRESVPPQSAQINDDDDIAEELREAIGRRAQTDKAEDVKQDEQAPPRPRLAWRRIVAVGLVLFIAYMVMVVKAEVATLPDHAFEGAVLQARFGLAPILDSRILRKESKISIIKTSPTKAVSRARSHNKSRGVRTRETQKHAGASFPETTNGSQVVVRGSVKPLRPLRIEVVDGNGRRMVDSRPSGIEVDTARGAEPFTFVVSNRGRTVNRAGDPDSGGSVVLRAIIGKDGKPERLWKVSGPAALTDEAIRIARESHFGPYYRNGMPMEMEAILTISFPPPDK